MVCVLPTFALIVHEKEMLLQDKFVLEIFDLWIQRVFRSLVQRLSLKELKIQSTVEGLIYLCFPK